MQIRTLSAALAVALLATSLPLAAQKGPKSQKEQEAIMKMLSNGDPASRITDAQALIANFKDTQYKEEAYYAMASAAEQLADAPKMILYSELLLKENPKNLYGHLIMARGYADSTSEYDLDKETKLKTAADHANQGIELAKVAPNPNPANVPAEQWEGEKNYNIGHGYETLAIAELVRKKYDPAIELLKKSVAVSPNPQTEARLGQTYASAKKFDEAIAIFTRMSQNADAGLAAYGKGQLAKVNAMKGSAK
jgi:tetratricopeptide (TPR) repeat protein